MSPAASTQSTATAAPAADREPEAPPPSGDLERTDNPTSANATSRTTATAAAAATTAIAPNVAQSMCTDGLLGAQAARSAAGGRDRSSTGRSFTLAAVTALRRDAT